MQSMHMRKVPSFFFTKSKGAPNGDELGSMKRFSQFFKLLTQIFQFIMGEPENWSHLRHATRQQLYGMLHVAFVRKGGLSL